jgi:signal transduction histidine kinase
MSQKIIEKQFDGKIDVQSSPEGTTFIVTIEAVQDILETKRDTI